MVIGCNGEAMTLIRRSTVAVGLVFITAVIINFPWEVAQSGFFASMGPTLAQGLWRCFQGSLGDGVMVVLLAMLVGAALRRTDGFLTPGKRGYFLMACFGAVIAIGVERIGLREDRWSYRSTMPLIPILNVGLVPVLQMIVLPPLIYQFAGRLLPRTHRRGGSDET